MVFRYRSARYDIVVESPQGVSRGVAAMDIDGVALDGEFGVELVDDGNTHRVRVVLG
jgi:cyclic beta-1,2-glucan synthetase